MGQWEAEGGAGGALPEEEEAGWPGSLPSPSASDGEEGGEGEAPDLELGARVGTPPRAGAAGRNPQRGSTAGTRGTSRPWACPREERPLRKPQGAPTPRRKKQPS